ncbi:hypothetical protein A0J61_11277, partial [Choanephora cucurbitarum]
MPAFKCSGCQCLFASHSLLRIHQRETGCFRSVIESSLAAFTQTRNSSSSSALGEDIPDFEGVSPVASVALNNPAEIDEADENTAAAQVEEEASFAEVNAEENSVERGPIVQQWFDDAQVEDCDDVAMQLMRVFDMNKISRQDQRNIFKLVILGTLTGKHFKTPDTYGRIIIKNSSTTVRYDICPNGCYLYPVGDSSEVTCPNGNCDVARYRDATAINIENRDPTMPPPALVAKKQMAYTSISQALTQLYVDDERSEMLSYRDHFF